VDEKIISAVMVMCCDLVSSATSSVGRELRLRDERVERRLVLLEDLFGKEVKTSQLQPPGARAEGDVRFPTKFGNGMRVDSLCDELEAFELTNAGEDLPPRSLEVVAIDHSNIEERLDGLDVLGLHLAEIVEEGELGEGGDERVALEFEVKETGNLDRLLEALEREGDEVEVVRHLKWSRNASEDGHPRDLEHGLDVLEMRGAVELLGRASGASTLSSNERAEESLFEK
jgi:hypothetical protein